MAGRPRRNSPSFDSNGGTKVIVVGAGPVGLAAALAAKSRGLDVILLEAEGFDRVRPGSRAIFLHDEPISVLDGYHPGIAREIYDSSMLWQRNRYTYRGRTIFLREYRKSTKAGQGFGASQSQRVTETLLQAAYEARGGRILWDSEVESVVVDDAGVDLQAADGRTWRADYVIAADGARSGVRQALGIKMIGSSRQDRRNIIVDVAELPDAPTPMEMQFHYELPKLGGRNLLLVPMEGAWRIGLQCLKTDDVDAMATEAGAREWLPTVMDARYADRITWISTYRFNQLVAERFTDADRRVLLIGEAAHLFAPWGGRGLNSGVMDAAAAVEAVVEAASVVSREAAKIAIDVFDEDRRDAGNYNRRRAEYALNLVSPATLGAKAKRRVAGLLAPYNRRAARWLATGPNGGYPGGRPGKGIY